MDLQRHRRVSSPPTLALVSAVLTGLLAGAMILIEVVLVPFWRAAPPAEFRQWFTAYSDRIRRLMIPLGAAAGVLSAASAVARSAGDRRNAGASVAAAAATAGVVAITVTVNEPLNHRFTDGALSDVETGDLLRKWQYWHRLRVLLGAVGAVAAASALSRRGA